MEFCIYDLMMVMVTNGMEAIFGVGLSIALEFRLPFGISCICHFVAHNL